MTREALLPRRLPPQNYYPPGVDFHVWDGKVIRLFKERFARSWRDQRRGYWQSGTTLASAFHVSMSNRTTIFPGISPFGTQSGRKTPGKGFQTTRVQKPLPNVLSTGQDRDEPPATNSVETITNGGLE